MDNDKHDPDDWRDPDQLWWLDNEEVVARSWLLVRIAVRVVVGDRCMASVGATSETLTF